MEPQLMRMFLREAWYQCEFAILAKQDIDASNGHNRVWFSIQSLLVAAANVTKVLWGSSNIQAGKRQPIRDLLGVTDSSPLRPITMRNHFEHFDERIDQWWSDRLEHQAFGFLDLNIGPGIGNWRDPPTKLHMRNWEPETGTLWFWGERYNVNDVMAEVQRIKLEINATELADPDVTEELTWWEHGYWEARRTKRDSAPLAADDDAPAPGQTPNPQHQSP